MLIHPQATARQLQRLCSLRPRLAMILGSGFQAVLPRVKTIRQIDYARIGGFPRLSVPGHLGKLLFGYLAKTPVIILCGRSHYYEGSSVETVCFPVRVLAAMGIESLLLTNAAGAIHPRFRPGDFMLITDHINLMGVNPLRPDRPLGRPTAFVDLSQAYDRELNRLLRGAARKLRVRMHSGVYLAVSGPSYETPAEIRAFAKLGADAVGMSTVLEAIVARQLGLAVAALSCISNLAAGRARHPLSHVEVLAQVEAIRAPAAGLLELFAKAYGQTR